MKKLLISVGLCVSLFGCSEEQADKAKDVASKIESSVISSRTDLSFDVCKISHKQRMTWGKEHCPSRDDDTMKMCRKIVNAADDCGPKNPTRF
jgi:hypothetical protein